MADLNEWRLDYDAVSFTFGTLASTYPFSAQVEIGEVEITTQDQRHPTSDGVVMGKDSLGGFDLIYRLTTIPAFPAPAKPWDAPMTLFSAFRSKWRADSVRTVPGKYATLLNVDRNRMVYGRPRKMQQDMKMARKGVIGYVATFETNDPNFYSGTQKSSTITPVPASVGGFVAPITAPIGVDASTATTATPANDGDLPTWPVIEFHGPGKQFGLELLSGSTVLWSVNVDGELQFDEVLTVDTRPWSRSATVNGKPANGRIRGTQIEKCQLPVGTYQWRFTVNDRTGTAFAVMKWRDAFASM